MPIYRGSRYALLNRVAAAPPPAPGGLDPADLFGGGVQGGWYDWSDIATLYQTDDTSTPVTTTGQAIGRVTDKSGCGNHFVQATSGVRPTYTESGGLKYSMHAADYMTANLASTITGTALYMCIGVMIASTDYPRVIVAGQTGFPDNSDNIYAMIYGRTPGGSERFITNRNGDKSSVNHAYNTWAVVEAVYDGTNAVLTVNGVAGSSSSSSGSFQIFDFILGSNGVLGVDAMYGNISGLIVLDYVPTERPEIRQYIADLCGLTL